MNATDQYEQLTKGFGAVRLARTVMRAAGPDAVSYLHGQLSQDVEAIAIGSSAWAWLLQPHGKVDALIRLTRVEDTEFVIDTDAGYSELVLERLNRFKLNTKVEFDELSWGVLALRGSSVVAPPTGVAAALNWTGLTGLDLLGDDLAIPNGATEVDGNVYDALRIEVGMPRMGAELDQLTIPAEAGVNDRTISFTKGCYTGQELVARIDSRGGNVPRNLRVIVIDSEDEPTPGAKVVGAEGSSAKPFGTLTSCSFSPRLNKAIALAYIRREVQPGTQAIVSWDEGPSTCTIEKPPLSS